MSRTLAIRHVTLIDGTGSFPRHDSTVLMSGSRIEAVIPHSQTDLPDGTTTIDASGKFLIPGLWDSHVHAFYAQDWVDTMMPAFVAHGITGIRDMHGDLELATRTRAEIAAGTRVGPRIITPGLLLDGDPPFQGNSQVCKTPDEGREAVRFRKKHGADYVKVYSRLARDVYFAIVDEAKKEGLPFSGHVPFSVTAAEASDAGQRAFEHLFGVELGTSTEEDAMRQEMAAAPHFQLPGAERLRRTFSRSKATALADRLNANDTFQVPTLVVMRGYGSIRPDRIREDVAANPRTRWLAPSIRAMWEAMPAALIAPMASAMGALLPFYTELVGVLHRAGVPMLAGCDVPNPFVFPGASLHDELELLVGAGLSEMAVLQAATANAARFLGLSATHGTVEPGKQADMVLLDADPLDNIRNTQKIAAVILSGVYQDRAALDALLMQAETAAALPLSSEMKAAVDASFPPDPQAGQGAHQ